MEAWNSPCAISPIGACHGYHLTNYGLLQLTTMPYSHPLHQSTTQEETTS